MAHPSQHSGHSFAHNEEECRYEVIVDESVAGFCEYELDYDVLGEVVVLPHTVIDPSMRGRGLAAALVRHVLEELQTRDVKVIPTCWFVAEFIRANPEFERLLGP